MPAAHRTDAAGFRRRTAAVAALALVAAWMIAPGAQARSNANKKQLAACLSSLVGPLRATPDAPPVPARVLAQYAILRRPQAPADVPPATAEIDRTASTVLSAFDPAETRLLASLDGASVYLVVGTMDSYALPARCRVKELRPFLPGLRAERRLVGSGAGFALVEVVTATGKPGAIELLNGSSFARNALGFGFYSQRTNGTPVLLSLVPDGVGAVQLDYANRPAVTYTAQDNVASGRQPETSNSPDILFNLKAARKALDKLLPPTVTWLSAPGGAIVQTFARPPQLVDDTATAFQTVVPLGLLKALEEFPPGS
jgi:hypothetical protein